MQREEYNECKEHLLQAAKTGSYSLNKVLKYPNFHLNEDYELVYGEDNSLVVIEDDLGLILSQINISDENGFVNYVKSCEDLYEEYYWLYMHQDIVEYLAGLVQETRPNEDKKFKEIALDVIGPFKASEDNNKYIMVITDMYTSWVEAFPIKGNISYFIEQKNKI